MNAIMFTCLHRIDIQDRVRRCASEPNEYNCEVDKLWQLLISKFDQLDQLRKSDILSDNKSDLLVDFDYGMLFNDLDLMRYIRIRRSEE